MRMVASMQIKGYVS